MRHVTLSVTAPLLLAAALGTAPAARAQNPPTYKIDVTASRTWTNDDVDQLRREAPVSFFDTGNPPAGAPAGAGTEATAQLAQPAPALTPRPPRIMDPDWYADQAAQLQAELDSRQSALAQYLQSIRDAQSRTRMTSGIALDKESIGVTPEGGVEVLQAQVNEIESRLEDLAELARQNGIPPGALRG